jgi:homoserine/homoserine lactone efflux protein
VLRIVGTAYLVYLGIKAWRAPVVDEVEDDAALERPGLSAFAVYRGGFVIAISNPKALLFAAAFLPQFIDPARPKFMQLAILIGTFAVIETCCYFTYAMGGRGLAGWLRRPVAQRWFNRVTGGVFMGFGAMLLRSQKG